jgi:hypothetical protein
MIKAVVASLFLVILVVLGGCLNGRPPEFAVSNPCGAPDGAGGAYVVYEVNHGDNADLYLQRLGSRGELLWNKPGKKLGSGVKGFSESQGQLASLATGESGNVTAVYASSGQIWLSRWDMDGNAVAEPEPVAQTISLPSAGFQAIGRGPGGTVIAWAADENHIGIQKSGLDDGYLVSADAPGLDRFALAGDADGNTFLAWKDHPGYSEGNFYIQKLDENGRVVWHPEGIKITGTADSGYLGASLGRTLISDGEGGAVVAWIQSIFSDDGKLITGREVYAQWISSEGKAIWSDHGKCLVTGLPGVVAVSIAGESLADAVICWCDTKVIYAQKLDITGNTIWGEKGIAAGQSGEGGSAVYYFAAGDGEGGAVITWNYTEKGHKYLRAQRIDAGSSKLWGAQGIRVSTVSPYWGDYTVPARIAPDGRGGCFVTWAAGEGIREQASSYIQRINGEGDLLWGKNGVRLSP